MCDLTNVSVFHGLDDAALAAVRRSARRCRVEQNAFLFYQGDPATTFYVLLAGHARLVKLSPEGEQMILRVVGPYQEIGIIAALPRARYPLSAQAIQACVALAWDHLSLQDLMERYPVLALRALRLVAGRFAELQTQYLELATERVERRIARVLVRLVRQAGRRVDAGVLIDLPLSRQDLAEMTGTTLYTVSRTLSRWEQQALVATGRQRILIRNPHGLVTIAEDLPPLPGHADPFGH